MHLDAGQALTLMNLLALKSWPWGPTFDAFDSLYAFDALDALDSEAPEGPGGDLDLKSWGGGTVDA